MEWGWGSTDRTPDGPSAWPGEGGWPRTENAAIVFWGQRDEAVRTRHHLSGTSEQPV